MSAEHPTNAEIVQEFGLALIGPEWASALGRLTGVNQRTMARIKAAAQDGKEYAAAPGVLAALAEAIEAFHVRLAPYRKTGAGAPSAPPQPTTPPKPKKPVSEAEKRSGVDVQLGPTPVAPGSRLKKR